MKKTNFYGNITGEQIKLMETLQEGKNSVAIKLIEQGVDPNFTTENILAYSPLYVAAQNDNIKMLRYLITVCKVPFDKDLVYYLSMRGNYSAAMYLSKHL